MERFSLRFVLMMVSIILTFSICQAQLSPTFYDQSCPSALSKITAIARERRMAASLIRMHFHDCFVHVSFYSSKYLFQFLKNLPNHFIIVLCMFRVVTLRYCSREHQR